MTTAELIAEAEAYSTFKPGAISDWPQMMKALAQRLRKTEAERNKLRAHAEALAGEVENWEYCEGGPMGRNGPYPLDEYRKDLPKQ